jgi:carbon-monoxide dehydrogenase iron sulfur subunit
VIELDISKCTGCHRCETACSFFHSGRINRSMARVKVLNLYEIGIDGPILCLQCQERYCLKCPADALSVGDDGQVIVSRTLCTLCGACEKNCPIGAVDIFEEIVYVCDLCGGTPKCVEACTEGALVWNPDDGEHPSFSAVKKETKKMKPDEKRQHYLRRQAADIREAWRKGIA